jgi:phospholipid-binding lipoprotein MlaA
MIAVLAALAAPASAQERGPLAPIVRAAMTAAVTPTQPAPRESVGDLLGRWGDGANRAIYGFNAWLYEGWTALADSGASSPVAATLGGAVENLFLNWINEPVTMVSYVVSGQYDRAGVSGQRFLVNTLRGWGGVLDPATERGLVVPRFDLGLALCMRGMPAGPYIVFPLVGPRTLRDGLADLVAANGLIYIALTPLALSTGTLVFIMVADELINLPLMRQIDAVPAEEAAARDFDQIRTAYLADRVERCEQVRLMH